MSDEKFYIILASIAGFCFVVVVGSILAYNLVETHTAIKAGLVQGLYGRWVKP